VAAPDFTDYQASSRALASLHDVDFVALIGISASGKSTLLDAVVATAPAAIHAVLTTTSRELRPGERQDIDLHIRSEQVMKRRIAAGTYVQVAPRSLGAIYATAPEDYALSGIAVMPVIASAVPAFLRLPFKRFRQVYILPPSFEVWLSRLGIRQITGDHQKRMHEAIQSLEYAISAPDLHYVVNDNQEAATDTLYHVLMEDIQAITPQEGKRRAKELLEKLKLQRPPL
jgi:guanylate kinase